MPSAYLQNADLATYGATSATAAQITQASMIIDAHLRRPEGLIWMPDGNGNPCYMAGLSAQMSLTTLGALAAGQSTQVPVSGPIATLLGGITGGGTAGAGFGLVIDRANPALTEAVQVMSVNGNVITIAQTQFAHAQGAVLEFGLLIYEERVMPQDRPLTRLSRSPTLVLVAGQGRYGYGRKGDQSRYMVDEYNLLASITHFGGPPVWVPFPANTTGINPQTGEIWVPAGILLSYYSQIRAYYVAGFSVAGLPAEVKQACANIIASIQTVPQPSNIKKLRAGDTEYNRFADSVIDGDTRLMLSPSRTRMYS